MTLLQLFSRDLEALVGGIMPSVVAVAHRRGEGTGVALSPDGYVLTNSHVVARGGPLRVRLATGESLPAQLVGTDPATDLAVLRVDATLEPAPFYDEAPPNVGQVVVAIGHPLRLAGSVSFGVVSAVDRALPLPKGGMLEGLVQTDAAINPGNSGGPLVDAYGRVVGINTAVIPYAQGLGFAVPATTATWVASVLMRSGRVDRPILGVAATGVSLAGTWARDAGQARAIAIQGVQPGSAAAAAGIASGDLLLKANGRSLGWTGDLQRVMVLDPRPVLNLELLRGDRRRTLVATPLRH